jgi:hypothetical protein
MEKKVQGVKKMNNKIKKILKIAKASKSKRFCMLCEAIRTFKYNRMVFHSECTKCGSRMARMPTQEELQ